MGRDDDKRSADQVWQEREVFSAVRGAGLAPARRCLRLLPPTAVGDKAQTEQRSSQKTEAAGLGDFPRSRAGSHDIARNARTTGVIDIDIRANVRTKEETLGVLGEVSEGYIIDRE